MQKKWRHERMKKVNKNDARKWKEFIDTMNDGDAKKVINSSTFDEAFEQFEHSGIKALFELAEVILLLVAVSGGLVLLINHLL